MLLTRADRAFERRATHRTAGRAAETDIAVLRSELEVALTKPQKTVAMILHPGKTPVGAEVPMVLRHVVRAIFARWPLAAGRGRRARRQPLLCSPSEGAQIGV